MKNRKLSVKNPVLTLLLIGVVFVSGCGRSTNPNATTQPARRSPTVASTVPGATDLIVGMGAAEHLVGVSDFDPARPSTENLPRVGGYQNFDWEQLAASRPDLLVVFIQPDRMPEALVQRAQQLRMQLVNVKLERLQDIFRELTALGEVLGEQHKAATAAEQLQSGLDRVRQRISGRPPVRAIIVLDKNGSAVAGRETFLDDVLQLAGGVNVVHTTGYPSIDRELLLSLQPEVILQLLPDASPQVVQQARRNWEDLQQIPAVADDRIYILTDWWVLQSGMHVGELAERFAEALHPAHPASVSACSQGAAH